MSGPFAKILAATTSQFAMGQIQDDRERKEALSLLSPIDVELTPEVIKSLNRQAERRANNPGNA